MSAPQAGGIVLGPKRGAKESSHDLARDAKARDHGVDGIIENGPFYRSVSPEYRECVILALHDLMTSSEREPILDIQPLFTLCRWLMLDEFRDDLDGPAPNAPEPAEMIDAALMFADGLSAATSLGMIKVRESRIDWDDDSDVTRVFLETFPKVRAPVGRIPFDKAVLLEAKEPVFIESALLRNASGGHAELESRIRKLAGITYHMGSLHDGEAFPLGSEQVGRLFGKEGSNARTTGSGLISALVKIGLLEVADKNFSFGNGRSTARKYRFMSGRRDLYSVYLALEAANA